ncbi:MAG: EamA family transporter [Candidatus Omnitrophica bacterium]|nr:EamA family transporter [Candidatus Omnitrophota bacterium]MDD5236528.1 EamA family transporter [Candidatus Omnitrophota bacterium]MDD5610738.1 EamA family transporter [Candidatus Omnitrophota bacterium]
MSILVVILLLIIMSCFDTASQLVLKSSINSLKHNVNSISSVIRFIFRLILIPRVYLSLLFSTASLFIWLFVLSKIDLNLAFSIDSMHYIFIAFASGIFLKERVGYKRWLGTILIVIGIAMVTLS